MDKNKYIEKNNEMKLYNKMHEIASLRNYMIDSDEFSVSINNLSERGLADYIHNNFSTMEFREKKVLLSKCLSERKIDCELLKYELKYHKNIPEKYMSLRDFEKNAKKVLKRYQWKVGGCYIEDLDWISHKKGSKYLLGKNQLILENTIDSSDANDNNFLQFMKKILYKLNNVSNNINVKLKYNISKKDSLTWILLKCTDITQTDKKIEL